MSTSTAAGISTKDFFEGLTGQGESVSEGVDGVVPKDVDLDENGTITKEEAQLFIEKVRRSLGLRVKTVDVANRLANNFKVKPIIGDKALQLTFTYTPLESDQSAIYRGYEILDLFDQNLNQDGRSMDLSVLVTTTIPLMGSPGEFFLATGNISTGVFTSYLAADQIELEGGKIAEDKILVSAGPMLAASGFAGFNPFSTLSSFPLSFGFRGMAEGHMEVFAHQDVDDEAMPIALGLGFDGGVASRVNFFLDETSQVTLEAGLLLYHLDLDSMVTVSSVRNGLYVTLSYGGRGGAPLAAKWRDYKGSL